MYNSQCYWISKVFDFNIKIAVPTDTRNVSLNLLEFKNTRLISLMAIFNLMAHFYLMAQKSVEFFVDSLLRPIRNFAHSHICPSI